MGAMMGARGCERALRGAMDCAFLACWCERAAHLRGNIVIWGFFSAEGVALLVLIKCIRSKGCRYAAFDQTCQLLRLCIEYVLRRSQARRKT